MSARVLNHMTVGATATIVSEPMRVVDDATRDTIAHEADAAYQRGLADGRQGALDDARAEAVFVGEALTRSANMLQLTIAEQHDALAEALATRVVAATAAVIGRTPTDAGETLVARLLDAVQRTDELRLTVRVAPEREAVTAEALAGRDGVVVEVDDAFGPDDVVLRGGFADLDLRTERLLEALAEVLDDEQPLGPLSDPDPDADGEVQG